MLAGVEGHTLVFSDIPPAGENDGQILAVGKSGLVVHATALARWPTGEVRHHKAGLSQGCNDAVIQFLIVRQILVHPV